MPNLIGICAFSAWLAAQILKMLVNLAKEKKLNIMLLWSSGGMPSSHSSTVCAVTACCAYLEGIHSNLFAVSAVFALIVMYDAAGVRRAVGEQAKLLNRMTDDIWESDGENVNIHKRLKELIGHTPVQVFSGALLGIGTGWLLPMALGVPPYAA
ncbi:MAG: divergent PAP2 family protein [Clostridia bacterium]|nr:divergent PAP2 family protein [Clostridia bacterium]